MFDGRGLTARVIRAPKSRDSYSIFDQRTETGGTGRTTIQRNVAQLGIGKVEVGWIGGRDARDECYVGVCGGGGEHARKWEVVAHLRNANIKQ